MPRGSAQPFNHPKKGSSIRVEPIRDRRAIASIKARLRGRNLRDYCLFTLGINTAYRAGELLSLTVGQVSSLKVGDALDIRESKTGKHRRTPLNGAAAEAIAAWLTVHPNREEPDAPLFLSQRRFAPLSVAALNRLIKDWCAEERLPGNYGSHTMRKCWGYHQRIERDTPIPLLMTAYGHTSEAQTLAYLHIDDAEISNLYIGLEL